MKLFHDWKNKRILRMFLMPKLPIQAWNEPFSTKNYFLPAENKLYSTDNKLYLVENKPYSTENMLKIDFCLILIYSWLEYVFIRKLHCKIENYRL